MLRMKSGNICIRDQRKIAGKSNLGLFLLYFPEKTKTFSIF